MDPRFEFIGRSSASFGPFPKQYKRGSKETPSKFAEKLGYKHKYMAAPGTWTYRELKDQLRDLYYTKEEEDVHFAEIFYAQSVNKTVIIYYYSKMESLPAITTSSRKIGSFEIRFND